MMDKVNDILDKWEFFLGQRAGRELWAKKSRDVQDQDIADFNRDIQIVRAALREPKRERGEWIEDGYYGNPFVCSNCSCEGCYYGDGHKKQYYYTNFCPACGADMRPEGGADRE